MCKIAFDKRSGNDAMVLPDRLYLLKYQSLGLDVEFQTLFGIFYFTYNLMGNTRIFH